MSVATKAKPRSSPPREDTELLAALAAGDLEALGELFDRHEMSLRRYFGRIGVTASDADDLVQQTFVELMRTAGHFDTSLVARSWIYGVATMVVRRHRRSLSRLTNNLVTWANQLRGATEPAPDGEFELDQTAKRISEALDTMAPKKREVFVLVALEELSGEEVSAALGIPVNTVWTRLHHARRELRAALEEEPS